MFPVEGASSSLLSELHIADHGWGALMSKTVFGLIEFFVLGGESLRISSEIWQFRLCALRLVLSGRSRWSRLGGLNAVDV